MTACKTTCACTHRSQAARRFLQSKSNQYSFMIRCNLRGRHITALFKAGVRYGVPSDGSDWPFGSSNNQRWKRTNRRRLRSITHGYARVALTHVSRARTRVHTRRAHTLEGAQKRAPSRKSYSHSSIHSKSPPPRSAAGSNAKPLVGRAAGRLQCGKEKARAG